jgi:hypothetical protein
MWADRFSIGIFILSVLFLGYLLSTEVHVTKDQLFGIGFVVPAGLAIVTWIALRTIDFMFGGPKRRRAMIKRTKMTVTEELKGRGGGPAQQITAEQQTAAALSLLCGGCYRA